uniref:Uncharacterized protein n=1 Tax=Panagrolaimus davidi TaxID=227884 RepID=A0A914PCD3_9BILA
MKDSFEIPRQQSDKTVPEVMNFKASQKLLDPKKNSTSPATVSSAPRDIHKNLLNESLSVEKVEHKMHEIVHKPVRAVLIKEYEKKVDEFVCKPENLTNLQNKIYSRELILLLREINKNFHLVPCPLSEDELKRIGIDRSTMYTPLSRGQKPKFQGRAKGRGRGGNVNASWGRNSNFTQKKSPSVPMITAPINEYKDFEDSSVADSAALDAELGIDAPLADKEKQPTADVKEVSSSGDETLSFDLEVKTCKKAFKMKLKCLQPADIDELVKLMIEHNSKMKIPTVYLEQCFIHFCENLKGSQENERQTVSKLILKCLQNLAYKNAFGNA